MLSDEQLKVAAFFVSSGTYTVRACHIKGVCKKSGKLRGRKLRAKPSYKSVLFDDTFLKFYISFADNVSQRKCAMNVEGQMRVAYYLRVSTESQELGNQRSEILPFIERRGWKLVHTFEDVMSGRKSEKDRPGFAAMHVLPPEKRTRKTRFCLVSHRRNRVTL